jgi:excisionase family DNA binding protein
MENDVLARAVGPIPFPTCFTLAELADLLKVDLRVVKRMVGNHEIAAEWIGNEYRILTKDLILWLLLQRCPGGERDGRSQRRRRTGA